MKLVIMFLVLISIVLSEPVSKAIPAEEAFTEIKKNILECISKDDNASTELKDYVNESLSNGYKEPLNFSKFRENETDKTVIRQCRRKAFIFTSKKRMRPLPLVPREQIQPKINI